MTLFGNHNRDHHRSNHHRPTRIVDQPPLTSTTTQQYQNSDRSPGNVRYDKYAGQQPFLTTEPVTVGSGGSTKNSPRVVQSKVYGEEIENVHVSDATDSSDSLRKNRHHGQNDDMTHHHKTPINRADLGPAGIVGNQNNIRQSDSLYAQPVDKILYGDKYVESSGGTGNSNNDSDTTLRQQQKRNVNFAAPIVVEQQQKYITTRIPNPLYQQPVSTIVGTRRVEDQIVNVPQVQLIQTERWPEGRSPSPELERIRREEMERMRTEERAEREYNKRAQQQQIQQQYVQEAPQRPVVVERRVETTKTTTTTANVNNNNNRNQSSPTSRRRNWQQKTSTSSSSSSSAANARARSPPPRETVAVVEQQNNQQRSERTKKFSSSEVEHQQREGQFLSDDDQNARTTIPVEYVPAQKQQQQQPTVTEYNREVVRNSHSDGQSQQQQQRLIQVERSSSNEQQFPNGNGREFFRQKVEEVRERHKSGGRPAYPPPSAQYASQTTSTYESPNVTVNGNSPAPAAQSAETGGRYATSSYSYKTMSSSGGAAATTTPNNADNNNIDQSMEMAQQRQAAIVNNANNLYATIQRESRSRNRQSATENGNNPQQQENGRNAASQAYYSAYSSSQSAGADAPQKPARTESPQYVQASDLQLAQQPAPPPRNSSLNYHAHYRRHHHHRHHGSRSRSGSRHHNTHVSGGGGDRSPSPLPNGNAVANAPAEERRQQLTSSPTTQIVKKTVTTKTKTMREELPAPPAVPVQEVQQVNVALSSEETSASDRRRANNGSYYAVSNKHVDRSPSMRRDTAAPQRIRADSTTSSTTSSVAVARNNSMRNGHISPARQKYEDRRQMQRQFEQSVSRGGSMQNLTNADANYRPSYPVQPTPNSSAQSIIQTQEVQYQAPRNGIRPVHALYRSHSTNGPRDQYYQQRYVPAPQQPSQFVLVQPQSRTVSVDRLAPAQQIYASVTPARTEPGVETTFHEREDIFIHNTPEKVVHKGWGFGPPYFDKELKEDDTDHDQHQRHDIRDEEYDTAPPALYNDGVYSPSANGSNRVRRKKSLYRRLSALVKGGNGNNNRSGSTDNGYVNDRADYYRPTNANAYAPNPQYGPVVVEQKPPAPVPAYIVQQQQPVLLEPQQQTYASYYTPQQQNVTVFPPQQSTINTYTTVDSATTPSTALVQPTNQRHFETIDSTGTRHSYVTETLPGATRHKTQTEIIYNVPPQPREILSYAPKNRGRTVPVAPPYPGYTPPISPTHDSYYYIRNDAGNSVLTPTVDLATGQPVVGSNTTQYYYTQPQTVRYVPPITTTVIPPQQQVLVSNGHATSAAAQPPIYFERRLRREDTPGHVMYEVNERRSVSPASGMFLGASAAKSTTYTAPQQQQVVRTTETTTTSYPASAVVVDNRRPPQPSVVRRIEYVAPQQVHHRSNHRSTAPRGILAQPPHVVQDHYNQRVHREVLTD